VVCPVCREPVAAADQVCAVCGAQLPGSRDAVPDHVEIDLDVLAGISDRGHVHTRNEDAMALGRLPGDGRAHTLAAVVCDGVSSVRRPELASAAATTVGLDALLTGTASGVPRMLAAIAAAADAVAQLAPHTPDTSDAPSCTLVAALVDEQDGRPVVTVGWVGDSRAYWLADDGPAELLTTDHSWAAEMVGAGILDEATAMRDRRAHAITRWLGADHEPVPGFTTLAPDEAGVLLLCTDGLWNYEPDAAELAALALPVLAREGPLAAAGVHTTFALDAGGRDNITVVCIPVAPQAVVERPPADA
jgi:serine/threonine protein phosphatase PrpC